MKSCFLCALTIVLLLAGCAKKGSKESEVDLSTPEAAVISFTKAAASSDIDSALACVLPEARDEPLAKCDDASTGSQYSITRPHPENAPGHPERLLERAVGVLDPIRSCLL